MVWHCKQLVCLASSLQSRWKIGDENACACRVVIQFACRSSWQLAHACDPAKAVPGCGSVCAGGAASTGCAGCARAMLVQRATDIPWDALAGVATLAITAGASAPEVLVDEIIAALKTRYDVTIEDVVTREERIAFNVPRELREPAGA